MKEEKKRIIKKYIFIFFVLFIVLTSVFIMIKYQVEGEKNMPYELEQIVIKSSIGGLDLEDGNNWNIQLAQDIDIYINIKPSENKENEEKIEKVYIENIEITGKVAKENLSIHLPTGNTISDIYENSTKNYINEKIEFLGNTADSLSRHEICADGGMIAFRIINDKIGNYKSEEKEIIYNGKLLKKAGINEEDLQLNLKFDIVIEVSSGIKYKSTLEYKLPVEKFEESSSKTKVIEDFSNTIFKR